MGDLQEIPEDANVLQMYFCIDDEAFVFRKGNPSNVRCPIVHIAVKIDQHLESREAQVIYCLWTWGLIIANSTGRAGLSNTE